MLNFLLAVLGTGLVVLTSQSLSYSLLSAEQNREGRVQGMQEPCRTQTLAKNELLTQHFNASAAGITGELKHKGQVLGKLFMWPGDGKKKEMLLLLTALI